MKLHRQKKGVPFNNPFENEPVKPKKRGRPKKIIEKNSGSVVEDIYLCENYIAQLSSYDSYTIEYISTCLSTNVKSYIQSFIKDFRNIVNKKARAYKYISLSGVRFIAVHKSPMSAPLLDFRIVCTSFEAALFIFSHLGPVWGDAATSRRAAFHIWGSETLGTGKTKRAQRVGGSFDLETGGRWASYFTQATGDWWLVPSTKYEYDFTPADVARVAAAAWRHFSPTHLTLGNLSIVKGAVGFCQSLRPDGTVIFNDDKNIYHGFRAQQCFGEFYNKGTRRIENHRDGRQWWMWK